MAFFDLALAATALATVVRGGLDCPTDAAVESEIARLSPADPVEAPAPQVELARAGDGLRVRLMDATGAVLAERALPSSSCPDLARSVAVVVASWTARLPTTPVVAGPGLSPRAAAPSGAAGLRATAPSRPSPFLSRVRLEAGGFFARAGTSWAPGLGAAGIFRLTDTLGVGLAFSTAGPHTRPLGPGEATWSQDAAALRLALATAARRGPTAELAAELLAAALSIEGRRFPENRGATTFDLGVGARLHLGWRTPRVGAGLDVGAARWLRPQGVFAEGVAARDELPRFQVLAGIGVRFFLE